MKICFITCIISNNDLSHDYPGKFIPFGGHDFYLFTNLSKDCFTKYNGWDINPIEDASLNEYAKINQCKDLNTNLRYLVFKSRYIKFMGWHYLKHVMNKEYDIIFYCDSTYIPNNTINWLHYCNLICENESGIIQKPHSRTPFAESKAIVKAKKDSAENMNKFIEYLSNNNCKEEIITENTTFGYNPNNKKITRAFQDFWNTYTDIKLTYRDQPLWGLISQKHNIRPTLVNQLHRVNQKNPHLLFMRTGENFNKRRGYENIM
tara:strand:+ start:727 stop:1512 length:786 start_codon:yes stop_codon:yes gene_type:complete